MQMERQLPLYGFRARTQPVNYAALPKEVEIEVRGMAAKSLPIDLDPAVGGNRNVRRPRRLRQGTTESPAAELVPMLEPGASLEGDQLVLCPEGDTNGLDHAAATSK